MGKGKGVPETPEGRVCRVHSSTPGNLGPGGVRGLPQAQGWLCGWSEQKPGLAASTPLGEPGLGPRDEGSSGDMQKPHLPRAERIKWA